MRNVSHITLVILFLCSFFAIQPAVSASGIGTFLKKIHQQEPTFGEVARVAYKNEKLDLSRLEEWKKKMRKAPWLPKLYFGYDRALKDTTSVSVTDNISVTSDSVTVGPSDNNLDETLNEGDVFRVHAVWSLDELIFHSSTLRISQEGRELAKSRLELSNYLFKIYGERRDLLAKYFLTKNDPKSILLREKINSLTEQLDLFTDNQFANRWWREK